MDNTYCVDERHGAPCPLPCTACDDQCAVSRVAYLVTEYDLARALRQRDLELFGPKYDHAPYEWYVGEALSILGRL